ncbi:putative glycoside hydrolase family 18 protein [Rhypophila decipiens]|uniref:chitinase n=1 Tax=Rhypophila decipiens TaxID=261697 RepID=A0AAN6XTH6_9PEZI|nr:putative glycoside hydrolase family 18 protein [Rhypophila decipiens]
MPIRSRIFTSLFFYVVLVQSLAGQLKERGINTTYQNSVYFTNWGIYKTNYEPFSLPVSKLSHVYYAFANIQSTGEVVSSDTYADLEKHYPTDSWSDNGTNAYGCVKQMYLLKKANRNLKVMLSIRGWTYAPTFPAAASTDVTRAAFASSAVSLITDWGFDGIDLDWEWQNPPPSQADAEHFVLLLQAVRFALDNASAKANSNYRFLLTVAAPAGPMTYSALQLKDMANYADFFNLMGYDYSGSFSSFSGHQANLYRNPNNNNATPFSTNKAIADYIKAGVPAGKIVLGMPIYGHYFSATIGLGQSFSMNNSATDVYEYNTLPKAGATEINDTIAGAMYSYDPVSKELVSYDTVYSVKKKVEYIHSNGLGGAMFWEASGDRNDSGSLVRASFEALGNIDTTLNLLSYPNSRYSNIAAGMPGE